MTLRDFCSCQILPRIPHSLRLPISPPYKWLDPGLNWGHTDFQSAALPTELSSQKMHSERFELSRYRLRGGCSAAELRMHSARDGIRTHDENNLDGLKVRYPSL